MKNQKIIVMDFATSEVHIFSYNPKIWASPEDFLKTKHSEQGKPFEEDLCQWMIVNINKTEGRLPLYIH